MTLETGGDVRFQVRPIENVASMAKWSLRSSSSTDSSA